LWVDALVSCAHARALWHQQGTRRQDGAGRSRGTCTATAGLVEQHLCLGAGDGALAALMCGSGRRRWGWVAQSHGRWWRRWRSSARGPPLCRCVRLGRAVRVEAATPVQSVDAAVSTAFAEVLTLPEPEAVAPSWMCNLVPRLARAAAIGVAANVARRIAHAITGGTGGLGVLTARWRLVQARIPPWSPFPPGPSVIVSRSG